MSLLQRLFGKREAAAPAIPAAPVPPPTAARGPAPGTQIHYHPELIGQLTHEHQLLLQVFSRTQAAAAQGQIAEAATRLEEFRVMLQSHLLTENVRLYIYLEHTLAEDAQSYALIHEFRQEMDGIGKVLAAFLKNYRNLASSPELAPAFTKEFAGVGEVLVERIRREEETLYPLYAH